MSTNPFDDDYNDFSGARSTKPMKSYTTVKESTNSIEDDVNFYEQEIERYLQESLDSTQRSRMKLEQSEQTGIKAAEDLLVQRDKLENTEKNLDEIERTTKMTQRNLNSLKSVFGGFLKNKFSRSPKEAPAEITTSKSNNMLSSTIGSLSENEYRNNSVSTPSHTLSESSRNAIKGSRWETMDNEIDSNLESMSSQLARLRNLGTAIGEEVDSQNEMLDRIQVKAERSDARVKDQDTQMKKLLGNAQKEENEQPSLPSVSKKKMLFSAVKGVF